MKLGILALTTLLTPILAFAEDGIQGKDYCYYFTTPSGWIADETAGKKENIPMVFYSQGSSWDKASTVIYTQTAKLKTTDTSAAAKIKAQIDFELNDFKTHGRSPKIQANYVQAFKNKSGSSGELWKYTGDNWGNVELVAYFPAKNTINLFVMSTKTQPNYEDTLPTFLALASSYREAENCNNAAAVTQPVAKPAAVQAPANSQTTPGEAPAETPATLPVVVLKNTTPLQQAVDNAVTEASQQKEAIPSISEAIAEIKPTVPAATTPEPLIQVQPVVTTPTNTTPASSMPVVAASQNTAIPDTREEDAESTQKAFHAATQLAKQVPSKKTDVQVLPNVVEPASK